MLDRVIAARVFLETVDRGTATAAAAALGMSRAMASRYLTTMEDWVGVRLLNRSTRHMSLTPAGENILAGCRELVAVSESINDMSAAAQTPQGRLRVAMPASLASACFVPLLAKFKAQYPGVVIDLSVSDRTVDLVQDSIDIALRITGALDKAVIARKLGTVTSVLCASPLYLSQRGTPLTPTDLTTHDCVTYAQFGGHEWKLFNGTDTASVAVNSAFQTNDSSLLLSAARNHLGISMLPAFAAQADIGSGQLTRVLPDWAPRTLTLYSLYASRQNLPASARVLLDFLASEMDLSGPDHHAYRSG